MSAGPARWRLFVALDLPRAAREGLAEWGTAASARIPGVRLVPAQSLHVTLCFLGTVEARRVDAIAAASRVALAGRESVRLTIGKPLWLPRRRPRVLALSLGDDGGELERLQAALAMALVAGGWYALERRPFQAHITVGRIGRDAPRRPPALAGGKLRRFTADTVTLYRSRTGAAGARYDPLATVTLTR